MPGESAQRLKRIIETGDLVALAVEDDLEDLARRWRDVQHDDPQLPCHVRCSLLLRARLGWAAIADLHSEHNMPSSCAPHARSPDARDFSRPAHGIWL